MIANEIGSLASKQLADQLTHLLGKQSKWQLVPQSRQASFILDVKKRFGDEVAANAMTYLVNDKIKIDSTHVGRYLAATWLKGHPVPEETSLAATTKFVSEKSDTLLRLRNAYAEVQTFGEPASYWEIKRKSHRLWSGVFGGAALLVMILGRAGILRFSASLHANLPNDVSTFWQLLPHTFPLLFSVILLLWILQVLVRLSMSHVQMYTDASERVVMCKTYLSAKVSGAQLDAESQKIILAQLFRHGPAGVVKEDSQRRFGHSKISCSSSVE